MSKMASLNKYTIPFTILTCPNCEHKYEGWGLLQKVRKGPQYSECPNCENTHLLDIIETEKGTFISLQQIGK